MLTEDNLAGYLHERGVVAAGEPLEISALSGGISNVVLRAAWRGGCVVVKQSLPELRVADSWRFDRSRIFVERDCMRALGQLLPEASVPAVVFSDEARYAFGMTCAPRGGEVWKAALMNGRVDREMAERVAALLRRIHLGAAADAEIRERFADTMPLEQGRLDPYHRTAAALHPDLATAIAADVERLLSQRRTLVLGDYSPKNVIAYPDRALLLDFEVAHWGDPAFDAAFMLCHLALKACWRPELADEYLALAGAFWTAYSDPPMPALAHDADVVSELGCLLLCRVDGKSKAEYLTTQTQRRLVRRLARELLLGGTRYVDGALGMIAAGVAREAATR